MVYQYKMQWLTDYKSAVAMIKLIGATKLSEVCIRDYNNKLVENVKNVTAHTYVLTNHPEDTKSLLKWMKAMHEIDSLFKFELLRK